MRGGVGMIDCEKERTSHLIEQKLRRNELVGEEEGGGKENKFKL